MASLASFQYCTADGQVEQKYPVNPNGSQLNLAGVGNRDGTVFAMMPHPERAAFGRQLPFSFVDIGRDKAELFKEGRDWPGPFEPLFLGFLQTCQEVSGG